MQTSRSSLSPILVNCFASSCAGRHLCTFVSVWLRLLPTVRPFVRRCGRRRPNLDLLLIDLHRAPGNPSSAMCGLLFNIRQLGGPVWSTTSQSHEGPRTKATSRTSVVFGRPVSRAATSNRLHADEDRIREEHHAHENIERHSMNDAQDLLPHARERAAVVADARELLVLRRAAILLRLRPVLQSRRAERATPEMAEHRWCRLGVSGRAKSPFWALRCGCRPTGPEVRRARVAPSRKLPPAMPPGSPFNRRLSRQGHVGVSLSEGPSLGEFHKGSSGEQA